ncbi:MAG: DUF3332 family protein [Nitrospirae bacterium]|nr:DUF3332 family protein [Nitrospirota bacterium]
MKRLNLRTTAIVMVMIISFMSTGCLGRFAAFNKLSVWNQKATKDKFVNEIIFLALNIIPVYGIALLADAVVFNSLEFWGEKNPMVSEGHHQKFVESGNIKVVLDFRQNGEMKTMEARYYLKDRLVNTLTLSQRKESGEFAGEAVASDGTAKSFTIRTDEEGLIVTRYNPEGHPTTDVVKGSALQSLSANVAALINHSTIQLASAH